MAGELRKLVTRLVLEGFKKASGELKKYDTLWKATAKSVEASADIIEQASARAMSSLSRVGSVAAGVRASAGAQRSSSGAGATGRTGGSKAGRDPLDAAIGRANRQAAREAGLAAGGVAVTDATRALGAFATASDRAKAKVADLSAQVERNRKEVASLREQVLKTGDADGTLTGRMQGLAVATGKVQGELREARGELRKVDGGLLDTIKSAAGLAGKFDVLKIAAGNLISAGISRGLGAISDGLVASAKAAIDFESNMADVAKVLSGPDLENFDKLSEGVKNAARNIGVMPGEVAALTASLAQSGIAGDELVATVEDASKLAVAFGISGEEAGQALAKLRTGLGLSRDEVNSLTGTINVLSNNLAATAPEITAGVQGVGSIAKAANVSAQSTAALVTAMIASGAGADVAATGTKNFIASLGVGSRATKAQVESYAALGLKATDVAARLSKGGKDAEATIKEVVSRIGQLSQEQRLPTLIGLFGKESIGAIGPLATNLDLLTKSFDLAGDAAEAAGSVEKEFAARSNTTDQALKKLKASVAVLAIEFGDALLPYINDVVSFLTSPEGQEWGRGAVEKAVGAVTTLASGVKSLVEFFGFLVDKIGGTGAALAALAPIILSLAGPLGIVAAAGVAMGAAIAEGIDRVVHSAERAQMGLLKLHNQAQALRAKDTDAERAEQVAATDAGLSDTERRARAQRATDLWEQRERANGGVARGSKEDLAITRRAAKMRGELLEGRFSTGSFEDRIGAFEASLAPASGPAAGGGAASGGGMDRFNELVAKRSRGTLRPSEAKELRRLSKQLDVGIPRSGGKGRQHKQTKMDLQLAAMDPALAGILTQGGETDAGGDVMVHDDLLSRGAFKAAAAGKTGLGALDRGSGGIGPGPNITNTYNNTTVTVQQAIDARSTASVPENIRSAARDAGNQAAGVVITGVQRARALQNAGGRMVPA